MRPNATYVPYLRPAPPYIIDVGREAICRVYKIVSLNIPYCSAATAKSVPRQSLNVIVYQVCSYIDQQDSVSSELRDCE